MSNQPEQAQASEDEEQVYVPFVPLSVVPVTEPMEAFYAYVVQGAKMALEDGKEVLGSVFIWQQDGTVAACPAFKLGYDKDETAQIHERMAHWEGMRASAYVSETWLSKRTRETLDDGVPPSQDPERTEALIVSIKTATQVAVMISHVTRNPTLVAVAPFQWNPAMPVAGVTFSSGRFVDRPPVDDAGKH